jgi:UPF0716 protein FxsA
VLVLLLILIAWPIAELLVAIEVAEAIGVLPMILLLIAAWPVGLWALRSHGRAAWQRLTAAVAAGRPPAREVVDGGLILAGGVMLIIPGFITDLLGICLLLAPTRALLRRLLVRNLHSRVVVQAAAFSRSRADYDVESTATDLDQPQLRR